LDDRKTQSGWNGRSFLIDFAFIFIFRLVMIEVEDMLDLLDD